MKRKLFSLILILSVVLVSCKKDNREPPKSTITGTIMYNKQPLSVKQSGSSGGVELELWQYGYQLLNKIPVYVNQDGKFSAKVFDGNYKLTLVRDNGPWANRTDSINVVVKGSTDVDVTVDPYFLISNATFQRSGTIITATFNIAKINTTKALELARLYIGQTLITDQGNNATNVSKAAAAIPDLSVPVTISATVPASLATKDYVYVRLGVKAVGVNELLYTQPQLVSLK
jgi:hypothetical protein